MSASQRQSGSMGEELTNAALIGLIALFLLTLILRATGSIAAFLTGIPQPAGSWAAGAGVLFNPANPAAALAAPGLSPVSYWVTTAVVLAGLVALSSLGMGRLAAPLPRSGRGSAPAGGHSDTARGRPGRLRKSPPETGVDVAAIAEGPDAG